MGILGLGKRGGGQQAGTQQGAQRFHKVWLINKRVYWQGCNECAEFISAALPIVRNGEKGGQRYPKKGTNAARRYAYNKCCSGTAGW